MSCKKVLSISVLIIITTVIFLSFSCSKEINTDLSKHEVKSFSEVFDLFWRQMNSNYVYWDVDTTNWDQVYAEFKPLFDQLNFEDDGDIKKSISYFRQMTSRLVDAHYSISFQHPAIKDSVIYPAYERKKNASDFHYPFPYLTVDSTYLDRNYILGYDQNNIQNSEPLIAMSGTIRNKILYFTCNRFSLLKSYQSSNYNGVKDVLNYFFSNIDNTPREIKGIIIDVRGNFGGGLDDLNFFTGRLIDKSMHFGFTRYKSNYGRLDFSPWLKAQIESQENHLKIKIPIVVLADRYSASLSEAITMAIHTLDNGIFVGETTWGATGPIANYDIFNAGSFSIEGFMNVETSSAQFKYLDGKMYEGSGFPPDIYVPFDLNALLNKIDPQLEKAITLIK